MGHDHHRGHAHGPDRSADARALWWVLGLTAGFAVAEVVGGLVADSLALLADAAHMVSDVASLALALGALWLASRPASTRMSFGYRRAEILAALLNGVGLVAVAIWIWVEAAGRLSSPADVAGGTTLVIGLAGLAVNVVAARILWRSQGGSLNVRAAFLHVEDLIRPDDFDEYLAGGRKLARAPLAGGRAAAEGGGRGVSAPWFRLTCRHW